VTNGKPLNRNLSAAKGAKQDEFYTQYIDIQKEVRKRQAFPQEEQGQPHRPHGQRPIPRRRLPQPACAKQF